MSDNTHPAYERQIRSDAAMLARCARGASWPGEMAERVEQAANRVLRWADGSTPQPHAPTTATVEGVERHALGNLPDAPSPGEPIGLLVPDVSAAEIKERLDAGEQLFVQSASQPPTPQADGEGADAAELRAKAQAASAGPWRWAGHDTGQIELVGRRGVRVITGARATPCGYESINGDWGLTADACEPCRQEAKKIHDPFVDYSECENSVRNSATVWLQDHERHVIRPSNTWAVREVPYRSDVVAVDHPDAAFIATFHPAAVLALLDELDRLHSTPSVDRGDTGIEEAVKQIAYWLELRKADREGKPYGTPSSAYMDAEIDTYVRVLDLLATPSPATADEPGGEA